MATSFKNAIIGSGVILTALSLTLWGWRKSVVTKRATLSVAAIQQYLTAADFVAARSALPGIAEPTARIAMERKIRLEELKCALATRDTGLIRRAISIDGDTWIPTNLLEPADLELAREAIQMRDFDSYRKAAEKWQSKTNLRGQWTLLEADQLLARKLPNEAMEWLRTAELSGSDDAMRYARLALMEANEPWRAMNSLDAGLKADPHNAELLSFRAQIQEAAGRPEAARLDYVAAVLSERKNPLFRETLANFYLRRGDLKNAAETWRDAAQDTGFGVYALKSWFWARVAGIRLSQPLPPCSQQGWSDLVAAMAATPDNVFWSNALEDALAHVRADNTRPEAIWLRLLEALRLNDVKTAIRHLNIGFSPEAKRFCPNLPLYLLAHLTARNGQNPRLILGGQDLTPPTEKAHPFAREFSQWAKTIDASESNSRFDAWLAKPNSLIGMLFASGWCGAALVMGNAEHFVPDPESPPWFDYGYAKSLLQRDGKQPARQWLESLPARTIASDLLLGELLLTTGKLDHGLACLQKIANGSSPLASRASWTLALTELDRGNATLAHQITLASPELITSVPGKELLARIALAQGDRAETIRIYQQLGDQSADAMIFLSKEAFAAGDFDQARKWTSQLAQRFPEQPAFRQNLIAIDAAQQGKTP